MKNNLKDGLVIFLINFIIIFFIFLSNSNDFKPALLISLFFSVFLFIGTNACSKLMQNKKLSKKLQAFLITPIIFAIPGIYSIISSFFIDPQKNYGFGGGFALFGGIIYIIIATIVGVGVSIILLLKYRKTK